MAAAAVHGKIGLHCHAVLSRNHCSTQAARKQQEEHQERGASPHDQSIDRKLRLRFHKNLLFLLC